MERNNRPRRAMGGPHGMGAGERAKDFSGTMRRLLREMGRWRLSLIAVAVLGVGSAAFSIIGPKKMGEVTTQIFTGLVSRLGGGPGIDYGRIGVLLLWLLGLYVVSAALSFAQHFIMTGVSQKLSYSLRGRLAAKVHRLPMSYFDRVTYGDVLSRVTNDVDTLGQSLNQSLSQVVSSLATAVGVAVMMLSISWQMTLAALLILPLSGILMGLVVRKSQKYFVGQQRYMGELNGQVEEMYAGHVVVKAFGAQESAERAFAGVNEKLYRSAWKSQFLSGLMQPITTLIGNLYYVDNCLNYIVGKIPAKEFMVLFRIDAVVLIFIGAGMEINMVWNLADVLMGVMALINLPVIVILARPALAALKDYTHQRKAGHNPVFHAADIGLSEKTEFWT